MVSLDVYCSLEVPSRCQDSFPCASWHSAEIRERETGRVFLKRGKESGRSIGQRFLKTGIREMKGGKIFEWIDG